MNNVFIDYKLPSLNEYVNACRKNRYAGATMKKQVEASIWPFLVGMNKPKNYPVTIKYIWYEKTKKRDTDNVEFAKKFILDSMVGLGILENDSPRFVNGSINEFVYGEYQGVLVEVLEQVIKKDPIADPKYCDSCKNKSCISSGTIVAFTPACKYYKGCHNES